MLRQANYNVINFLRPRKNIKFEEKISLLTYLSEAILHLTYKENITK